MNVDNLRRLARRLRRLRHEEHYEQEEWARKTSCGTAACVAGHAVLSHGYRLVFEPGNVSTVWCRQVGSKEPLSHSIRMLAREILDLDYYTGEMLFAADADKKWPAEFAARWAAGKERKSRIAADLVDAIADGRVKLSEGGWEATR